MKRSKISACILTAFVMAFGLGACSSSPQEKKETSSAAPSSEGGVQTSQSKDASKTVNITFLNSKAEIQAPLEEAAKIFTAENPDIKVQIIPAPAGKSPFEVMSTMINSGNTPSLAMIDSGDIPRLKDKFADLKGEKWISDAVDGSLSAVSIDDKVLAFPFAFEGYGLIYNKAVLDNAYGGSFDPSTIQTRSALKEAFSKVEASGKKALIVSPMDWSLGAHMFSFNYIVEGKGEQEQYTKLFDGLKGGTFDVAGNESFNNWMDTFDLLKEYNSAKKDPLSVTYEKGPELIGKGDVGFWFMGNWAWPQIKPFDTANGAYGFIPYPMSDDKDSFGNSQIVTFASKFVGVDISQNSPEQQEASKKFLNWLVYENSGQDALVNKMNLVPAFKNITLPIADPLGQSIVSYMSSGKTLRAIDNFTVMPADHWSVVGASLQKYLSNNTDRAGVAKDVTEYWKNVK